jgi:DNA-binding response OmpR family regulator
MSNVLVLEDDPATYKALPILLKEYGHTAVIVSTIADAIDYINNNSLPDALILDLMLPDGNGRDFLKYLNSKNIYIKYIITTGSPEKISDLENENIIVLVKPIELGELLKFLG